MNAKENVQPFAIAGAVVVLVGLLFFLFRANFGSQPHNVSPENAPDYAKKSGMVQTGGTPTNPQAAMPAAVGGDQTPYGQTPSGHPSANGPASGQPAYGR